MLVLNGTYIREHLETQTALRLAREAMELTAGDGQKTPLRSLMTLPNGNGLMGCMPGWIGSPDRFGIKLVNIFPENTAAGLSSHLGAVLLFDGEQGKPLALLDGSVITAMRTAAVSAVATDALSNPGAQSLGIFGTGEQAAEHLRFITAIRPINRVYISGSTPEKSAAFIVDQEQAIELPGDCRLLLADNGEMLSKHSDIICTLTSSRTPLLHADWLRAGQHINAVGASQPHAMEITPEHVERSRYFVDSRVSLEAEAGEYGRLQARTESAGEQVDGTLGEVLTRAVPGRLSETDVTVYRSLGIAVQDMVFASYLYDHACRNGLGQRVDF